MKKTNIILKTALFIFLIIFILYLLFIKVFYLKNYSYIWEDYFYLWLLLSLTYSIWAFKLSSRKILLFSMYGYILGALFSLINLNNLAEGVFRSTFIGFLVGIVCVLIEYRRSEE